MSCMNVSVRFTESVKNGDLDFIKYLHESGIKLEVPDPKSDDIGPAPEIDGWLELINSQSDECTYYLRGGQGGWKIECQGSAND